VVWFFFFTPAFVPKNQPRVSPLLIPLWDGCEIEAEFFTWHMSLSPSVLAGIKNRWRVDLAGLEATPVKIGQTVIVFLFSKNVGTDLAEQLADIPHRRMADEEFLESSDFVARGSDPNAPEIYAWKSEAGSDLFAVIASAPALTLLSLWVISEDGPARHNIQNLMN
jgi:hypothetical protein